MKNTMKSQTKDESAILCSCGAARYSAACSLLPEHPHVKSVPIEYPYRMPLAIEDARLMYRALAAYAKFIGEARLVRALQARLLQNTPGADR